MQSKIMKNRFLLTTALLLGSVGFAAAQGMGGAAGGGDHQGLSAGTSAAQHEGATSSGKSGAGSRAVGEGHAANGREQGPSARHGRSHQTAGEAQPQHPMGRHQAEQNRRSESGREATTGAATHQRPQAEQHREQQGKQAETSKHGRHTTGMATHERGKQAQQRAEQQKKAQGQHKAAEQRNTERQGKAKRQGKAERQGRARQQENGASTAQRENTRHERQGTVGAATQSRSGAAQTQADQTEGRTRLSDQQRTRIRQSVLSERNVPRVDVNDIHFRVRRGVEVPSRVSVVSVSRYPELVEVFPEYRDDSFFVTEDEIIFVAPDHRVVNVVPVGPRAAPFARRGGGHGYTAVNLPPDEIREVQEVLIQRGFLTGEADGIFGPRTRDALIAFQRKEGIEANGSISTRTVAALGLSDKIDEGQTSTIGEGRGGANEPNRMGRDHDRMNNNGPTHDRATTGEAGEPRGAQEPSEQHHPGAGEKTTGEAGPHNKSTAGEAGNQPANKSTEKPGGNQGMQSGAQGTTGEGNGQAPGQSNAQSPGQGAASSGQQGSGPTRHNQ